MGKDLKGKELGTGISQRKNGSYCGRYFNRTGKRVSLYNKDLRVLKKELNKAIYEVNNGIDVVDKKIVLDEWFKLWLFKYKKNTIRENTKRHYLSIYTLHISPYLGGFRICEITKLQCKELIDKVKEQGLGWETQNKVRVILFDMFERALDDNYLSKNPVKGLRLPINRPNDRKVLTVDEQALFFECASGTFYNNLFIVAINTGLRPGELFALTWDDIDLKKREIRVTKTLVYQKYLDDTCKQYHLEEPKTKKSIRIVPINKACESALKKQYVQKNIVQMRNIKSTQFKDCLFTTKFNTPLNSQTYSDAIKKIIMEINLMLDDMEPIEMFSGHTFRHTFATRCIESNIAPKTLQAYLGHTNLQMTMDLYVHNTEEHKQSEMTKLDHTLESITITDKDIDDNYERCLAKQKKIITLNRSLA